jgi:hypothetical protein
MVSAFVTYQWWAAIDLELFRRRKEISVIDLIPLSFYGHWIHLTAATRAANNNSLGTLFNVAKVMAP